MTSLYGLSVHRAEQQRRFSSASQRRTVALTGKNGQICIKKLKILDLTVGLSSLSEDCWAILLKH